MNPNVPTFVVLPNFKKRGGLITAIAQDIRTKMILMVAYTNEAGFRETLETGEAVYWSTSRKERWKKGETSGDTQIVRDILVDCDGDAVIYLVEQQGKGACHTGAESCFFRSCLDFGSIQWPRSATPPFCNLKPEDLLAVQRISVSDNIRKY